MNFEKMAKFLQGCDAEGKVYTDKQLEEMKEATVSNSVEVTTTPTTDKVEIAEPVVKENEKEDLAEIPSFLRGYVKNEEESLIPDFVKEFSKRNNEINRERIRRQEEAIAREVAKLRKPSKKKSVLAKIFR